MIWLIAGVALAAGEALTGDFVLLMLGGAALATAGVAAVTDLPVWFDAWYSRLRRSFCCWGCVRRCGVATHNHRR